MQARGLAVPRFNLFALFPSAWRAAILDETRDPQFFFRTNELKIHLVPLLLLFPSSNKKQDAFRNGEVFTFYRGSSRRVRWYTLAFISLLLSPGLDRLLPVNRRLLFNDSRNVFNGFGEARTPTRFVVQLAESFASILSPNASENFVFIEKFPTVAAYSASNTSLEHRLVQAASGCAPSVEV